MSQSEVERFVADLKSDAVLREDLKGSAAGVASVVAFAQSRGYDIGADEARQYIQAQTSSELSDSQLDHVAGGKGHHHHTNPPLSETDKALLHSAVVSVL